MPSSLPFPHFSRNPWVYGKLVLAMILFSAVASVSDPFTPSAGSHASTGNAAEKSLVLEKSDFNRESLLAPDYRSGTVSGFQLLSPRRFSMSQSYSMGFGTGGGGSYSSGLYLNTLSYRLADPLTFSVDVGFHTPFYSSLAGTQGGNIWDGTSRPSLVLPRMGLNYRPTENTSLSLELVNGPDAYKAYGYPGASPFWRPW